tara:strand:+ start:10400 stop:10531 length:132 start_codon:yes stop_codon:yes gene_type:complete
MGISLPLWTPSTKERIAALWKPEPTLRGLDAASVSLLNLDHLA